MRIAESLAKMKLQAVAGEEEVDEALRLFQVSTLDAALSGNLSGTVLSFFCNKKLQYMASIAAIVLDNTPCWWHYMQYHPLHVRGIPFRILIYKCCYILHSSSYSSLYSNEQPVMLTNQKQLQKQFRNK